MHETIEEGGTRESAGASVLQRFLGSLGTKLEAPALDVLQRGAVQRRYASGQTVYFQDDPAHGVHVVAYGCVLLEWRAPDDYLMGFRVASSGDSFGLRSYCAGEPRSTIARAVADTLTVFLRGPVLEQAAALDGRIYRGFARIVASDAGPKISRVTRNGRVPVVVRLAFVVLQLAERLPVSRLGQREHVDFPLQQKDLANLLDVSQETVSRTMRDLEARNLLRIEHGPRELVILDRAGLAAIAGDYLR